MTSFLTALPSTPLHLGVSDEFSDVIYTMVQQEAFYFNKSDDVLGEYEEDGVRDWLDDWLCGLDSGGCRSDSIAIYTIGNLL